MTVPQDPQNQEALRSLTREMLAHVWGKTQRGEALAGDEALVAQVLGEHPEFGRHWESAEAAVAARFDGQEANPFLHVHLHLTVEQQLRGNDPPEAREFCERRTAIGDSAHAIRHRLMGALAEEVERMVRAREPFDEAAYRRRVRKL